MRFNRVVVAVDFSAASLAAARWVAMQLTPRAEVVLAHEWLALQMRQVSDDPRRVTSHVRVGDPGEQIVKFVRGAGVDLVTIGRGRDEAIASAAARGADAFRLGSTSRLVLWASPCPVLVLPPTSQPAEPALPPHSDKRRFHLGADMQRPPATRPLSSRRTSPDGYPPAARLPLSRQSGTPASAA